MFNVPKQFSTDTMHSFELQLKMLHNYSSRAFENTQKIFALNVEISKVSLEHSIAAAKHLITARDPQEFFARSVAQARPDFEKWLAYGREMASLAVNAQNDLLHLTKIQAKDIRGDVRTLTADVEKAAASAFDDIKKGAAEIINPHSPVTQHAHVPATQHARAPVHHAQTTQPIPIKSAKSAAGHGKKSAAPGAKPAVKELRSKPAAHKTAPAMPNHSPKK